MFDWAKGSTLNSLSARNAYAGSTHEWQAANNEWLKNWSLPWIVLAIDYHDGLEILDVGSGHPILAQHLHNTFGSTVSALDVPPDENYSERDAWGFSNELKQKYPDVTMHFGLAGDDILPAESFDVIICNSVIEHTFDRKSAASPENPLGHISAIRDMCRMLRPGGFLIQNWDTYLDGIPHHAGWDYMADIWLMQQCGMHLVDPDQIVRSPQYILNDTDTLFFSPRAVGAFATIRWPRGVCINTMWIKPGAAPRARAALRPGCEGFVDVTPRAGCGDPTTDRIDTRFRNYIGKVARAFGHAGAG